MRSIIWFLLSDSRVSRRKIRESLQSFCYHKEPTCFERVSMQSEKVTDIAQFDFSGKWLPENGLPRLGLLLQQNIFIFSVVMKVSV